MIENRNWVEVGKMGSAGRELTISLDGVRDKNLMQLKKLNIALFPVRYNDKYYTDALASGEFTKLGPFSLPGMCLFFSEIFLDFMINSHVNFFK